jgi:hypothetical protein
MMRAVTPLLLLAVSACASSGPTTESTIPRPTERIVASDYKGVVRSSEAANAKTTIRVPPGQVLAVMKSVYEELGIPSATVDAASGQVSAPRFDKMRRLGTVNLSTYFNCGDSLNGNIANTYRLYITVLSAVRSDGKGGAELETAVTGAAADVTGGTGGRIPCGSTGVLEQNIQDLVRQKVGAQ